MTMPIRLALIVVLSVAQLAAAGWSIARYESTRAWGTLYRIPVAPVDPADAFRGRYVAVRPAIAVDEPLAAATRQLLDDIGQHKATGYVVLGRDERGFATAVRIVPDPPPDDHLEIAEASRRFMTRPSPAANPVATGYTLSFAFDRYYMPEASARLAEQRYAEITRRNSQARAWLEVRVRNGAGVVTGLYLDGVPIEQLSVP